MLWVYFAGIIGTQCMALCIPYKVISKILASRLAIVLLDFISKNKTGFLQSKQINDNVGLAHEFPIGFNNVRTSCRACISLDFKKAFNMIKWDVMDQVLLMMGFDDTF